MDIIFQIVAVVLAGVAAYFLWNGDGERGFVAVVAGAVAFFLSIRVQVKRRNDAREAERIAAEEASGELTDADEFDAVSTTDSEQMSTNKF